MADDYTLGDSEGTANDAALEAVAQLMRTMSPDGMISKFILAVEVLDKDDRWMFGFCAPDQKKWDTLGLLAYLTALESNVSMSGEPPGD